MGIVFSMMWDKIDFLFEQELFQYIKLQLLCTWETNLILRNNDLLNYGPILPNISGFFFPFAKKMKKHNYPTK